MSKRITDEERIVGFFNTASLDKAETLLNVINGIIRSRKPPRVKKKKSEQPQPVQKAS